MKISDQQSVDSKLHYSSQVIPNPVNDESIKVSFPVGFAAEEITIHLEPETGLAPELFDVEIIACLGE